MRLAPLLLLLAALPARAQDARHVAPSGAAAITMPAPRQAGGALISEGFESVTEPGLPPGWTAANVNGDDKEWITQANPSRVHTGAQFAAVYWNTAQAADDWLFTPTVTLTAGTSYTLDMWFRPGEAIPGAVESFEISLGAAATVAAMTTSLYSAELITAGDYIRVRRTFTPAATGPAVVGFHCFSPADQYFCGVDDVTLAPTPTTAILEADQTALAFDLIATGQSAVRRVVLQNTGTQPLTLGAITTAIPGLTIDTAGLDATLAPDDTTSFAARFAPSTSGAVAGAITVQSDAPNAPIQVGVTATGAVETLSSGTTVGGPTLRRPSSDGTGTSGSCTLSGSATAVPYVTYPFTPTVAGLHRITAAWTGGQDGYLLLYEAPFDPADACRGLVGRNDDGTARANSQFDRDTLVPGRSYTLVITGFGNTDAGPYDLSILSPAAVTTAGEAIPDAASASFIAAPNPAADRAMLRFVAPSAEHVRVEAFDASGRNVAVLFDGHVAAGEARTVQFDVSLLPAGMYVVRTRGKTINLTQRVTVVR